jgi:hypothetical protein
VATIATYLALTDGGIWKQNTPAPLNVWQTAAQSPTASSSTRGISVVTFGTPPTMATETEGSTALIEKKLCQNFHHYNNVNDPIPFVMDDIGVGAEWAEMFFRYAVHASGVVGGVAKASQKLWDLWKSQQGKFAHFGCMYSIEANDEGSITLTQIVAPRLIPKIPAKNPQDLFRFHSIAHYVQTVGKISIPPQPE